MEEIKTVATEKKSRGRPKKQKEVPPTLSNSKESEVAQKAKEPEPKIKLKSVNYSQPSRNNPKSFKKVRKTVVYEEEREDQPDPHMEEEITFVFRNEEQKGIPQFWLYVDKWTNRQGTMYEGQKYTLPRKIFEYLRDKCQVPEYSNIEKEIIPGQTHTVSQITGYKKRFDLQVVAA